MTKPCKACREAEVFEHMKDSLRQAALGASGTGKGFAEIGACDASYWETHLKNHHCTCDKEVEDG